MIRRTGVTLLANDHKYPNWFSRIICMKPVGVKYSGSLCQFFCPVKVTSHGLNAFQNYT